MVPYNIGTLVEKPVVSRRRRGFSTYSWPKLDAGAHDKTGNHLSNQPSFNSYFRLQLLRPPAPDDRRSGSTRLEPPGPRPPGRWIALPDHR